jgi:ABC-type polysaccharide/polyol phosphate export permease
LNILNDLAECKRKYQIWNMLAHREILFMFKRTKLGVFWLILESLLQVIFISAFASLLFERDWIHYILQVTVGLLGFELMSKFLTQGTRVYSDTPYLTSSKFPPLIWNFKLIWKQMLIFRYEFFVAVLIVVALNFSALNLRLGLLPFFIFIIFLNGFSFSVILGIIGARFRDFQNLVSASIRLFFFLTPVFWSLDEIPSDSPLFVINEVNPFAISIEFLRYGFSLGEPPNALSISVYIFYSFSSLITALIMYNRYSQSLRVWL